MKTTQQLKEIYEANPDEWIAIWKFSNFEDDYHNQWTDMRDDYSDGRFIVDSRAEYKLIHIKHKDVLEAYLADNSVIVVVVEAVIPNWIQPNFIENYNQDLDYRLKKQFVCPECEAIEDDNGITIHKDYCIYKPEVEYRLKEKEDAEPKNVEPINDNIMRVPPTMDMEVNSFTAHGFETPDFEGEILKEVGDRYIGYILYSNGLPRAIRWNQYGYDNENKDYKLTPVKREWYEDESNFPAVVTRNGFFFVADWSDYKAIYRNHRLATRSELMSLYCKEE